MHYTTSILIISVFLCLGCNSSKAPIETKSSTIPLAEIDYTKAYTIKDAERGSLTEVNIKDDKRVMTTNSLPNHSTGQFPNPGNPNTISAQQKEYTFSLNPKMSTESRWSREPGIAVNGIKFEPETAERFVCASGEVYKIEAIQELLDLGLDHNHAHVQPTGAYHYHGVPTELIKKLDKGEDLIQVGFAKDGFPMYYSKSGQYKPSYKIASELRTGEVCEYKNPHQAMSEDFNATRPDGTFVSDWVYEEGLGQLDECNGIEIDGLYRYFLTEEYPYVSRCLKGEFVERKRGGRPPGAGNHPRPDGRRRN